MPSSKNLKELHGRLVAGDHTAPPELAGLLFADLCQSLRQSNLYGVSDQDCDQAAADALISYLKRPSQYDPAKSDLAVYLRISAMGDLRNLLQREKKLREKFGSRVELSQIEGNDDKEVECFLSFEEAEQLRTTIREMFPDERDWQMALLVIDQERRTEPFAEILKISHLPWDEQRRDVKRHKDRIKQKLRRYGESIRDQYEPD